MPLTDFFKLNEPYVEFRSPEELLKHFKVSADLRGVLYRPNELSGGIGFEGKKFTNVSFSKTTIREVTFRECEFTDCLFIGTEFVACEFHECTFVGCNPHKISFTDCYIDPVVFDGLLDPREQTNMGLHLYNQLEKNARAREQHEFVAAAAYRFQQWLRFHLNWRRREGELSNPRWFRKWVPNYLYDQIAGYGWRISRFVRSTALLLIVFTSANWMLWDQLGMDLNGQKDAPRPLTALYYTITTFATLGDGHLAPTSSIGMMVGSVEALVGVLWLSILASVVFRRIFR